MPGTSDPPDFEKDMSLDEKTGFISGGDKLKKGKYTIKVQAISGQQTAETQVTYRYYLKVQHKIINTFPTEPLI